MNVIEAFQKRMDIVFSEFDNIIISFSGGKDSGVLLNLTLKYIKDNNIDIKPIVFHQDVESQYTLTSEYVERTYNNLIEQDLIDPYWCCQSIGLRVATSVYQYKWLPWNEDEKDLWTRPMPKYDYIKTNDNFKFKGFYKGMEYHEHFDRFNEWVRDTYKGKTISMSGIRTQESLNRYRAVMNKKHMLEDYQWTMKLDDDLYRGYPIYDFTVEDIWATNAKFGFDYNKIYDKMYLAGATPNQMRVASPFHDDAQGSLEMFKIVEPEIWDKLLNRVQGAAFTARYAKSKAMGKNLKEPPNNLDWRQFTRFLLRTLPEEARSNYANKFMTSLLFWHLQGGGLYDEVIAELKEKGYNVQDNGKSPWAADRNRVIFKGLIPTDTDDITTSKDVPSWKRMCKCLLKNDYACLTMGFGLTKEQSKTIDFIRGKGKK